MRGTCVCRLTRAVGRNSGKLSIVVRRSSTIPWNQHLDRKADRTGRDRQDAEVLVRSENGDVRVGHTLKSKVS